MSRYRYSGSRKPPKRTLTSTQKRFVMAVVIGLVLIAVQLVIYLKN